MSALILKRCRRSSMCPRALLCVAMILLAAGGAHAEDHVWSALYGGSFNHWMNWVPQFVPGADDTAIFELGLDPAYEVTFYESVTNERCIFRTDKVTLDLGGFTYALTYPGWGLNVAEDAGQVADVLFYNGTLNTDGARVGTWPGSDGTLELVSPLTMNVANHFFVGDQGAGLMIVRPGVSLTADYASIGVHDPASTGALNIGGPNAEFSVNGILRVGQDGFGVLDLDDGAMTHTPCAYVGDSPTGYGEIHLAGASELIVDTWLTLGREGSSLLTVAEASQIEVLDLHVGGETDGYGQVELVDADSRIDVGGYLHVGSQGTGVMNVSRQATVTAETLLVGAGEEGEGELNVSDPNTTVTVLNNVVSGQWGVGALNITNGADVRTTEPGGWILVGQIAGSDGYVLVDGGSVLTAENAPLVVGGEGQAGMDILGGSVVHTAGELFMGSVAGSVGQLTIRGAGSKYISETGYPAQIGDGGQGTLIIEDGGRFEKLGGCRLGLRSTGVGSVTLSGDGCVFKCGEHLGVGEYGVGTFTVNDGRVAVGEVDPADVPPGEVHVAGWAQLTGTGTVNGDVVNLNARVMPGGDPAATQTGVLTIDGDYTQQDATLAIKIKGTIPGDEYGMLNVTGAASLAGTLHIEAIDGFVPEVGQQYVILTAGAVTGEFQTVVAAFSCEVVYAPTNVTVVITAPPPCRGDTNCDGQIDFGDINAFVDALLYSVYCDGTGANADVDGSGTAGFEDINPFVDLLMGNALPIPCP